MKDENTASRPLSIMDGVELLKQSRDPDSEQETEQDVVEETKDQADAEQEAVADTEAEAEEVEEDQSEEEAEEDEAEPQEGDVYQAGDFEFTLAELKEWKDGSLRQSDYTKKTQDLSQERASFATERQQFEAERNQAQQTLQQQHTQLQDALATFVVDQDPEPKLADYSGFDEFREAKVSWDDRAGKRQEAQHLYQAIQAEQQQAKVSQEFSALVGKMPDLRSQDVFKEKMGGWQEIATDYGYSPEEFAGFSDHRLFLALNDLQQYKSAASTNETKAAAAKKKVVKATKALTPAAKTKQASASEKTVREANSRLKKTGSRQDAVAALQARRASG